MNDIPEAIKNMPVNFETAEQRGQWITDHAECFRVGAYRDGKFICETLDVPRFGTPQEALVTAEWVANKVYGVVKKPIMIYAVLGPYDTLVKSIGTKT